MNIKEKEKIEIEYWKNSPRENPDNFSIENIVNKLSDAKIFLEDVGNKYNNIFNGAVNILELGAG